MSSNSYAPVVLRKVLFFLGWAALGGVLFWTPDIIVHAIAGPSFSGAHVDLLSVLMPVVAFATAIAARYCFPQERWSTPRAIAAGIWLFGGLAMMITASFSGGGFAREDLSVVQGFVLVATFSIPPVTFIAATYDGTLLALLLSTVLVFVPARFAKPHGELK